MKKIYAIILALASDLVYGQNGVPVELGSKVIKFWEKNAQNLNDTIPWDIFVEFMSEVERMPGVSKTLEKYSTDKESFIKLPGFSDGNCLWTHLGIEPEKMYNILTQTFSDLQDQWISNGLEMTNELAVQFLELIDALDPLEQVTKEDQDIPTRVGILAEKDAIVRKNWLNNVKKYGGGSVEHNGSRVAFRPLNSNLFFQHIADTLGVKIHILTPDSKTKKAHSTRTINPRAGSKRGNAPATLYLLQDEAGLGKHYDIAIPWGKPVSAALINEMSFFLQDQGLMPNSKI